MSTVPAPEFSLRAPYDRTSIVLHWVTAGLVIALWVAGQTIDWFPRGTPRVLVRSTHITAGSLLGLILFYRVWWRLFARDERIVPNPALWERSAVAMHALLYIVVPTTILLGMANALVRGDNIFGWFTIESLDPGNKALRKTVETLHAYAANTLLVLAGLHAAAGLYHHFALKDYTLRNMLRSR